MSVPKTLSFALISLILAGVATAAAPDSVLLNAQEGRVALSYGGVVRVVGGAPHFEGADLSLQPVREEGDQFTFPTPQGEIGLKVRRGNDASFVSFFVAPNGRHSRSGEDYLGFFFGEMPGFRQGVSIWRYKPWNAWSKPVAVSFPGEVQEWDVQFFYWQYDDGTYAAALPLSGSGYRTTLGQSDGQFGAKAVSRIDGLDPQEVPMLTIGFGRDPYRLFAALYEEGLRQMGKSDNMREKKEFPEILDYIGWCTWNASDNGRNLGERFLIESVQTFHDDGFPLGWVLIDDGWFNATDQALNGLEPDSSHFPNGFRPVVDALKSRFGVRDVGIWHALDGHWNGINPDSPLGRHYRPALFSWTQASRPDLEDAPLKTYHFIRPTSDSLYAFYDRWYRYFKSEGISFVKVDNQLVVERMCVNNYPIWDVAEAMHGTLNRAVMEHFDGAIINCMDMTADAYFNLGATAVGRSVEDYFPYEEGETYDLQRGNAAAHVLQAVYNALYFGQMVYPDFDMFQSHNPNATLHAIARAANNGPIYLTDTPGKQQYDVLWPLVYGDGRIIRSDTPLLPTEDCLFQVQEARLFKAFSLSGPGGLLAVMNLADADRVTGAFRPSDVRSLEGSQFAVYEHFSGELHLLGRNDEVPVALGRMGHRLYSVVPMQQGMAPLGLVNKYNAPATVLESEQAADRLTVKVYEGGRFAVAAERRPAGVLVDGKDHPFDYQNHLVVVDIEAGDQPAAHTIEVRL